jgi:type II secretory pathway pseudopilin PulG
MLGIISTILATVAPVLEKLIPDPDARAQAQVQLQQALQAQQTALLEASKDVMVADAASEGWLTRNARPCVVFWALGCMTWIVAVAPVFGLVDATLGALKAVPDNLWNVMLVGIGGYTLARGAENAVKSLKGR